MLALLTNDHLQEVQARRRAWGAAVLDEVWDGIPHLVPVGPQSGLQQMLARLITPAATDHNLVAVLGAFEPRDPDDHHAPKAGAERLRGDRASTAALAVEIAAEDDLKRLRALAADRVEELLIVNPTRRTLRWLSLVGDRYEPIERSRLLDLDRSTLVRMIEWPGETA